MASVAKWLRQWIVVPPLAGSSPVVRPQRQCNGNKSWNRHLACVNFQASCLCQLPGISRGTGILPVSISRHLACVNFQASCLCQLPGISRGTGILPVSISGRAGCPLHSYSSRPSVMPKKNAEVIVSIYFCLNSFNTLD